eukprot:Lithocolla_globosa_v1_NODE_3040_length_1784_cov_12.722383.p3 type:complete len:103 gc:universal NODE_3040_length_1784_cov_12.722383:1235-1543(+)
MTGLCPTGKKHSRGRSWWRAKVSSCSTAFTLRNRKYWKESLRVESSPHFQRPAASGARPCAKVGNASTDIYCSDSYSSTFFFPCISDINTMSALVKHGGGCL